jgi:methylglutaconyl-CoA hydratase
MNQSVEVSLAGGVARVALNRPAARNAFNAEMIGDLTRVFEELHERREVRVIVLTGNGPTFSAGADVSWMRASLDLSREENVADARRMSSMFAAIEETPQSVIACVHGACLGGGMGLIAVCDCVIAADDVTFGFTETKLGIIPAVISTFVLPKIGESWARALFLTGERFGPELGRLIGLVHWIETNDQLGSMLDVKIQELLSAGPEAVRAAKQLVLDARHVSLDERREFTAQRIAAVRASSEGQEGLRAFLERRQPSWRDSL